jgi:beta-mannosidase
MRETVLLSQGWKYRSGDASSGEEWYPAQPLPTTIHLDLLANGAIPDPFIAKNEELVQMGGRADLDL